MTGNPPGPPTITDRSYSYNLAGDVLSNSDSVTGDTQCYGYDYLRQLTQAWSQGSGPCASQPSSNVIGGPAAYWQSYSSDAAGNRTLMVSHTTSTASGAQDTEYSYSYPPASTAAPVSGTGGPNAVSSITTATATPGTAPGGAGWSTTATSSYSYDAAGGTTARPGQTIGYDSEHKPVTVTLTSAGITQTDVYGADGNLLIQADKHTGGADIEATLFLGDTELRATGDGTGQPVVTGTRTYSVLGQQLAVRVANLNADGSSATPPTQLYWLDNDNQGTTTTLIRTNTTSATASTTSNSAVTYRYTDPYGNPRGTATPPWPDSHGFLNQPTNADTGLVHLGARDYDPTTGRFLTVDPVFAPGNPQQENGYSYARNNPASESDPTGLIAEGDNGGTDCSNNQCVQAAEDTSRMNAVNAGLAPMSDQQMCDSECNFGTGSDFVGGLVNVVNDVRRVSPLAIVFKDPYDNQRLNKDFGWDPHSAMFNIGQTAPFVLGGPEGDTGEALAGLDGLDATGASIQTATKAAAETVGSTDTIVLGHYPEYVDVAKATGGRTFQVPTKVWDSMTPEQQWAANQRFLDRAIARGSNVRLATPANAAREGSFFERELQYMQSKGYTVGPDGMSLVAPGAG